MRRFKRFAAVALAAVMSVAMLTACGGGGGGGGTPVAPSAFKSTKTYRLAQSGKGKSLYVEYWEAGTNNAGEWADYKNELLVKQGSLSGNTFADLYSENSLFATSIQNNGKEYVVAYYNTNTAKGSLYNDYVEVAIMGGAEIPEGKNVYFDPKELNKLWGGGASDSASGAVGGNDVSGNLDQIQESKVTASTGTYTIPGTSQTYYAEIFTSKTDPKRSVTYAYDKNDELKAVVSVNHDKVSALFFDKFEFDSPMVKASRFDITSYNAVDITYAYIAGVKKMQEMQGE